MVIHTVKNLLRSIYIPGILPNDHQNVTQGYQITQGQEEIVLVPTHMTPQHQAQKIKKKGRSSPTPPPPSVLRSIRQRDIPHAK